MAGTMMAEARNAGMAQMVWREPTEDEPLSMVTVYGVNLWVDGAGVLVVADLPQGFEQRVV